LPRKKKQTRRPVALLLIGFLFMIGAVALWILEPGQERTPTSQNASIPFPEIARTNLNDAVRAFESGSAIFLDVRTEAEFAQSRIPGSKNIPLDELPDRLGELDPQDRYLTICT
jgi:3-mercaptopyruvate sulfurtransferase SseA